MWSFFFLGQSKRSKLAPDNYFLLFFSSNVFTPITHTTYRLFILQTTILKKRPEKRSSQRNEIRVHKQCNICRYARTKTKKKSKKNRILSERRRVNSPFQKKNYKSQNFRYGEKKKNSRKTAQVVRRGSGWAVQVTSRTSSFRVFIST